MEINRLPVPERVKEWLRIANEVRIEADHDNVVIVAAGVAFYSVLAIIPAMIISLSLYGLFTDLAEAERQIDGLLEVLPGSTARALDAQMRAMAAAADAHLSIGFVASLAALLWTVSNALRAIVKAVKIAYDQETERSILENRAVAIAVTVAIVVAMVVSLALIAAVPVWIARFDPTHAIVTFANFRWILIGAGFALSVGALYRYGPPTRPPTWIHVVPGVVLAATMWIASSIGFSIYVSSFGRYNETYGTLGAAVVLLLWFWLGSLAVILGAELNEVLTLRRLEGSTPDAG